MEAVMSKGIRALTLAALATGALAAAGYLFVRWSARAEQVGETIAGVPPEHTRESLIEAIPESRQLQILQELQEHI